MPDDVTTELAPYNLFEFGGELTQIRYSTSSEDGRPRLSYSRQPATEHEFSGDEIEALRTPLGIQLKAAFPTAEEETVTLVVPTFGPSPGDETPHFKTFAVITFTKPPGAPGARQSYFLIPLNGMALTVEL